MSLPIFTTAEDIRSVVAYLKTKPTGALVSEAKAVLDGKLLDGRKLSGYQTWGLIEREGDRIKLSKRGWDLSRTEGDGSNVFQASVSDVKAYQAALEWAHHQGFSSISNVDVAAYWHEHHGGDLGTENENTIKDNAVCFFHLAQAAGFGTFTLGRRGNATRLDLNREALRAHVESGLVDSNSSDEVLMGPSTGAVEDFNALETEPTFEPVVGRPEQGAELLRVFVAHGGNMDVVEQVQTMLGLADIESEVAENEETTAIPVSQKVLEAMRRCTAGVITVTVDEGRKDQEGNYAINENVLIEIGAAFVLYDKKVVLVWDKRLPVPSNLQGLYRCEFEGDELSWSAGMKLMKAIQEFRKRDSSSG